MWKRGLLVVGIAALVSGCTATTSTGGGTTPVSPGTTFKNCSSTAAVQAAQSILSDVTTALATGNYIAALATLVTQYGSAEVACAVELAVNEVQSRLDNTPTTAAPDPLLLTEISNGKSWLATNGAK